MVRDSNDLLLEDIAVAAHADLKPISRVWESTGQEHDEGVLRVALLARQQAELRGAQRDGWVLPLQQLHTLLPCFAPPSASGAKTEDLEGGLGGTLSTAGSGLTTMDTDDGSAELAAAAAAALASQEEREAAAAAAEAERQARRETRRSEKERRRQQLLQVRGGWWNGRGAEVGAAACCHLRARSFTHASCLCVSATYQGPIPCPLIPTHTPPHPTHPTPPHPTPPGDE